MVRSLLTPVLVLVILVWNTEANHMKNREPWKKGRMGKEDFKNLRIHARDFNDKFDRTKLGRNSGLRMKPEDVKNKKHLDFIEGKCEQPCPPDFVCMEHKLTKTTKCIQKKLLEESRKLLQGNFGGEHNRGMRKNHFVMEKFGKHDRFSNVNSRLNKLDRRPQNWRQNKIKELKKNKVNHKEFISRFKLIENMDEIDKLMHIGRQEHKDIQRKYPVCASKLEDIRKRLNGWFVMLHEQKRDHRNRKHLKNRSKFRKTRPNGDYRTIGHCNCGESVLWERRNLDKDEDTFLNKTEVAIIEAIHQEQCVTPLLESCDINGDSVLSKKEWCCCFTDTEAPCFKHLLRSKEPEYKGFKPTCNLEGYYERTQCDSSTQECWCSDLQGNVIQNTKMKGEPHCERFDPTGKFVEF